MKIIFDTHVDGVSGRPEWRMHIQWMDEHNKLQQRTLAASRFNFKSMEDCQRELFGMYDTLKAGHIELSETEVKPLFHHRELVERKDIFG